MDAAARTGPRPPRGRASATLPPVSASATAARHIARGFAVGCLTGEQLSVLELLTTELVTNAVAHARTACDLDLSWPEVDVVRVEVSDSASGTPAPPAPAAGSAGTHGRGLTVVDSLASAWGVERRGRGGKSVWFELRL